MRQRKRILSPDILTDADLAEVLNPTERLFFLGLWTIADREGRLEDKPREIKLFTIPYDRFDVDAALQKCHEAKGILERYEVNGKRYIQINPEAWAKHQSIHANEKPSVLPLPETPRNSPALPVINRLPSSTSTPTSSSTSTVSPRKSSDEIPYEEIISDLNEVVNRNFKYDTPATQKHIRDRWNEGYKLEHFQHVHRVKADEWLNDPKFRKFLRPETLYSPKFEGYVNEQIPGDSITDRLSPAGRATYEAGQRVLAELEAEDERKTSENN